MSEFKAIEINSNIEPATFVQLEHGLSYYNYGIHSEIVPSQEGEETRYYYSQVIIGGTPNVSKCTEEILKLFQDENGNSLFNVLMTEGVNTQISDIIRNIKIDFGVIEPLSELGLAKERVIRLIKAYDTSDAINSFTLEGKSMWLPNEKRISITDSINKEKASGQTTTIMWFDTIRYEIPVDTALYMLQELEVYAKKCYNTTEEHKVNVSNLQSVDEVNNYDYKSGYPDKLIFSL